MKLTRT